jgi:hypothetical protein
MAATTPNRTRSPRVRIASIALALASIAACLVAPSSANATATNASNYRSGPATYAGGSPVGACHGWGGDADDAGHLYTLCLFQRDTNGDGTGDTGTPALVEYDTTGTVVQIGWLPTDYYFGQNAPANYNAMDIAVTPDGKTAYAATGPNIDNLGQHPELHPYTHAPLANGAKTGTILRLRRQADGTWAYDPTWHAGPFLLDGNYWSARRLSVDGSGRVYTSVNDSVYELSPVTGGIVTAFGGATTTAVGGRWVDGIDKAEGIDVAADGNSIYVVEQQHQLVERWLRVGATDWKRDTTFLLGVPDEVGDYCETSDHFQSPYDVATDAVGDVYVMDTTCNRVQRFTKAGVFVQTVWTDKDAQTIELSHAFAVNWQGSIILPSPMTMLTRLDPPAKPGIAGGGPPGCKDLAAPKVTKVGVSRTTHTRAITLTVSSNDDCTGADALLIAGNRLGRVHWTTGTSTTIALGGWNGRKRLVVEVRDGARRIGSAVVYVTLALPQPRLVARSRVNLAGRGCSSRNPMSRVGGASAYRLVDRCARFGGRVLRITRSRSSSSIEVLVPATTARAIYANAVGAVRIWVVTDSHTRFLRRVRRGRPVVVTGSLVAQRNLRATYAIPVDAVVGR